MKLSIGTVLLVDTHDGSGAALSGLAAPLQRVVQVVDRIRADEVKTYYRGNKKVDLRWSISRPCDTESDMWIEFFRHESEIPSDQPLKIESTDGRVLVTIPGNLTAITPTHTGTRLKFDYQFIGGIPVVTTVPIPLTDDDGEPLTDDDDNPITDL